jgi:hypothetical protein
MKSEKTKFTPSQGHYDILLAQMLVNEGIAHQAATKLEAVYFKESSLPGTGEHAVIFVIIKTFYNAHEQAPDEGTLRVEIDNYINKYLKDKADKASSLLETLEKVIKFSKMVNDKSVPMTRELIQLIYKTCVTTPELNSLVQNTSADSITEVKNRLADLEAKQNALIGGLTVDNIFEESLDEIGQRSPLGIPWLDAKFGGGKGPVVGSAIGIIAPQAGGKTSLSIQIGVSQALLKRHVLIVLVEEGLSAAVRRRIVACCLGISTAVLEDAKDNIEEAVTKSGVGILIAKEKVKCVAQYLHVLDLVKNPGGLMTIMTELERLQQEGKKPEYVYIDWAGILADRLLGPNDTGRTFKDKTDAINYISNTIAVQASKMNNIICISQQMAGERVQKGPTADHDHYCAADSKAFTAPFQNVFVINPRHTQTGVQLFKIAKSRHDPPSPTAVVKLHGEMATFTDVSHAYEIKGKHIKSKKAVSDNKMPDEGEDKFNS